MISKPVCDAVAKRAKAIRRSNGQSQTESEKDPEEARLKVKPERLARASMQLAPSTRLLEELEVGTVSRGEQGRQLSLVNGSGSIHWRVP